VGVSSYLLDTHVFLWLLSRPDKVAQGVRDTLGDPAHTLLVSAASAMEIATKTRLGKLDGWPVVTAWQSSVASIGATELPVSGEDAILAGTLDWDHRDPFDRLLVAQTIRGAATLVTADHAVRAYPPVAVLPI